MNSKKPIRKAAAEARLPMVLLWSLAANVALGCGVGWLLWHGHPASTAPGGAAAVSPLTGVKPAGTQAKVPGQNDSPHPLQPLAWSQLETPEFPDYISRLRGVGCPEPTIRDIIKGELDEIYGDKRRQMLVQHGEAGRRSVSATLQREFDRLTSEEDHLLAQLLGHPATDASSMLAESSSGSALATPPRRMTALENMQAAQPLAQPLVLREVDAAALNLTPSQQGLIEQMRAAFIQKIGGLGQDPNDPEYLSRWRKAQYEVDTQLRTTMGDEFVTRYRAHVK